MAKARHRPADGEPLAWAPYAFSEESVARFLKISQSKVRALITTRRLPARVIEGEYIVRRSDLNNLRFDLGQEDAQPQVVRVRKILPSGGTVYVIGFGPYVKIGFTAGLLRSRLAAIQTGSPEQLVVYGQLVGSLDIERALHQRFADLNTYGEWFRREGALAEWIEKGCPPDA